MINIQTMLISVPYEHGFHHQNFDYGHVSGGICDSCAVQVRGLHFTLQSLTIYHHPHHHCVAHTHESMM